MENIEKIKGEAKLKDRYIVIKLPDSYKQRSIVKEEIERHIKSFPFQLEQVTTTSCVAGRKMPREFLNNYPEFREKIKEDIAVSIGRYLLEQSLIQFNERSITEDTLLIECIATVVTEGTKEVEDI